MSKKLSRAILSAAMFASTFAAIPAAFAAPVLQGVVGDRIGTSFAASFTDVTYVATGASLDVPATLICIDMEGEFPTYSTVHSYTPRTDGLFVSDYAGASSRATDLYNYAVDRFFDSMVLNEGDSDTGYQFSLLMWEIEQDFDGQASSLDPSAGWMTTDRYGDTNAYATMVRDMYDNYSTIAEGYRSTKYTVSFLDDSQAGYQAMLMLTPSAVAAEVPEPGTLALSMLGGLALLRRKQRAKAQQA